MRIPAPVSDSRSRPGLRAILLAVWVGLPACGGEILATSVRGSAVAFSLLTAQRAEILQQNEDVPIALELAGPRRTLTGDGGVLPSLIAAPPARVRFTLPPDTPRGSVLRLAVGFDVTAYERERDDEVYFGVHLGGELQHESIRLAGPGVPPEDRAWERLELPVGPGDELVLVTRSRSELEAPDAPRAAFALLDVVAPVNLSRARASREAPNLVVLLIDTLRADRLGCYGYEKDLTPAIDSLADRGTLFERAYAPSSWTWPSTASLLTGLSPPAHGVVDSASCYLAHDLETFAERLRDEGFATAACSTNPLVVTEKNFDQGFDEFHETAWGDASDAFARVEPWLRERGDERFFLYVQLTEPHTPYRPREDLVAEWLPGAPPEGFEDGAVRALLEQRYAGQPVDEERLSAYAAYHSALYDAEIATADHAVGEFLELLGELGLEDRTIVVITSDHGHEFLDHGRMGHGKQLFDEVLHVPLVVTGPGVPPDRIQAPVELTHVGGTLLDLLGVPRGGRFAGPNLVDAGESETAGARPFFFTTNHGEWLDAEGRRRKGFGPLHAVRVGDLLFLYRPELPSEPGGADWRLHDLANDPRATRDLSGERPELVDELRRRIEDWLERELAGRPTAVQGGSHTLDQLEEIGYVDR